jgi:hypothetical protein
LLLRVIVAKGIKAFDGLCLAQMLVGLRAIMLRRIRMDTLKNVVRLPFMLKFALG